ncbi:SGNH hydrolase domain-containing protein [Solirubrobacter ginsenosidimutans]|uniref:SGNH hydrolase domain-containing protein n=1 Tax=Solirubrobacter ginsenosidimutans TaxID=490573 RepID=A0A9X3MP46_9ACTN|nr:SGNH hydrolase domain-containing protein [Solirubrobacter ginsenosidimutans]MDA0159715.1 SGNH hydrolase domain-containing protein [Solirubrobacter ginsenosidimutans]
MDDALSKTVTPRPSSARTLPNSPCRSISRGSPAVCRFGADVPASFALVGDSHAGHWRAAFEHLALAKGWGGVSITRTSCPLQQALRDLPEPRRTQCGRWKNDVFAWFAAHPEIGTVFVAGLSGGSGVVPRREQSRYSAGVDGYLDAWRALGARRVVALRDTPRFRGDTDTCIERALRRRQEAGTRCAVPRAFGLSRDPIVGAAARAGAPVLDLTPFFCDSRCYPVVGGALVVRDANHMTGVFSSTLGPYVLRAFDRLTGS